MISLKSFSQFFPSRTTHGLSHVILMPLALPSSSYCFTALYNVYLPVALFPLNIVIFLSSVSL
nr:MAG TPA: hypothetical protein [Inoviridae sp.]